MNTESLLTKISSGEILSLNETKQMIETVNPILHEESNLLLLDGPVHVIGDIHGDMVSLEWVLRRLDITAHEERVLFLGDYVDRGSYSVPVLSLLLCLKVIYPERVFLLRGNHECLQIGKVYGFYDELKQLYEEEEAAMLFDMYGSVFNMLPLAALIGGGVLAVHAGLSEDLASIEQIQEMDRFCDVPMSGLMTDLLWSDPHDDDGWKESPRGASKLWGPEETKSFCSENNLKYIIRSHQLVMEGAKWTHEQKVLTIFSSANYCMSCQNDGGYARISETLEPSIFTYPSSIHDQNQDLSKYSIDRSLLLI
eukprot:TRINITY_DN2854_c0_g2_i1.p1 TRINITY_DN2854_c0_g2~~TRINITY_DN2854_c0_g2_i1.p1  ORF type:complete len:310 (-),score=61.88 TRINITY_DN2854_c0_g2_i1:3-932(-)